MAHRALQPATLGPTPANDTPRGPDLTWFNAIRPDPTNQQLAPTNRKAAGGHGGTRSSVRRKESLRQIRWREIRQPLPERRATGVTHVDDVARAPSSGLPSGQDPTSSTIVNPS
jgi:hypothetical protein